MTTTTAPSRVAPPSRSPSPARRPGRLVALVGVAVRDRLALAGAVAVLMLGMGLLAGSLWPSLQEIFADLPSSLDDIINSLVGGSAGLSTPEGWVGAQVLSLVAPAGVVAAGVISAVRGVAGEEEDQTLGVLLSAPVSRTTFVLAKASAMVVHVVVVVLGIAAGLVLGSLFGDLGLSSSGVVGVGLHAAGLGVLFGTLALALAALTGQRRLSSAVVAGLAGLSFVAFVIFPLVDAVSGLAKVSPWYWFAGPEALTNGADAAYLLLLLVPTVIFTALAAVGLQGRDLRS